MDKINASGLGVTASIKDGKVVITANEANDQRIFITDGTSDFSEIAGFTLAEAGKLRKSISKKRMKVIDEMKKRFFEGAKNG